MDTKIKVWSRIGHTPITKRDGAYCDVLVDTVIDCETPEQARVEVKRLIAATPHAADGHFNMPEFWNQNTRSSFVS